MENSSFNHEIPLYDTSVNSSLSKNLTWLQNLCNTSTEYSPLECLPMERDVTELAKHYPLYNIAMGIYFWAAPFLVFIGFFGNTLSFLVMHHPANRHISCCVYMKVLALSDNMMILIAAYYFVWLYMTPVVGNLFMCQLTCHFYYCFSQFGVYLVVAITCDRYIAVVMPLKRSTMCTPHRAKVITAVLISIFAIYNIPYFFTAEIIGGICVSFGSETLLSSIYSKMNVVLVFIPSILLVILNLLIFMAVRKSTKFEEKSTSAKKSASELVSGKGQPKMSTRESQLVGMLVAVTVALLVLTTPEYVQHVVFMIVDPLQSVLVYSIYFLLYIICSFMFYINNAINVFLYCLSGPRFRKDAFTILFGKRCSEKILTGA